MYTLAPDERTSLVMAYTLSSLIRGEAVVKEAVRVSTWLRTDSSPEYIHLLKPQVINLTSNPVKSQTFAELYLPSAMVIGFHMVPPVQDPVDYDESETNRKMEPVTILVGTFIFLGKMRISTQTDAGTSITKAHTPWISFYEVEISNPGLPQMGILKVPMLMVRPGQVSFVM